MGQFAGKYRSLAALALCLALPAPLSAQGASLEERFQAATSHRDCQAVMRLTESRLALGARLGSRPVDRPLLETGLMCAASIDDQARTGRFAIAATSFDGASDAAWRARLWAEVQSGEGNSGVDTILYLNRSRPALLNAVPAEWLLDLDNRLKEARLDQDRVKLLGLLTDGPYESEDLFINADYFRSQQIMLLARMGDMEGARRALAASSSAAPLLQALIVPELRPLLPAGIDLHARVEADLARHLGESAAKPQALGPLYKAAQDLRLLGRFDEALAVLLRAERLPGGPHGASDAQDNFNWWENSLGETYYFLGRYDEMVAAYRAAMASGERDQPNVSQTINLAGRQFVTGHPQDALETLAGIEISDSTMSEYGQLVARRTRGCAAFALGKLDMAHADLVYVRDHRAAALDTTVVADALLCQRDEDGAAAEYIALLGNADPEKRAAALSTFMDGEPLPPAVEAEPSRQATRRLAARPDVAAAIARAGGTVHFPLVPTDY